MTFEPHTDLPAELTARYETTGRLGAGASSTVYLALRRGTSERVVLKVFARGVEDGRARFEREAAILEAAHHPGIVRLLDHGVADGVMFMVLEFQKALTLAQVLTQVGSLKVERGMRLIRELAETLGYAHGAGVLHRDLKPANILVTKAWQARLIDFGIAHVEGAPALTGVGIIVGTPAYAAPEVLAGRPHDTRSDLYALGLVAYETLTGENPYARANLADLMRAKLEMEAHALPPLPDGLDPRARAAILRLLSVDPRRRCGSAADFLAALDAPVAQGPAALDPSATGELPSLPEDLTQDLPAPPPAEDATHDLPSPALQDTPRYEPPAPDDPSHHPPPPPSKPSGASGRTSAASRAGSSRSRRARRRSRFVGPVLVGLVVTLALVAGLPHFNRSRSLEEPSLPRASAPGTPMTRLAQVLERFDARAKNRALCAEYERRLHGTDALAASSRVRREWDARLAADTATLGLGEALAGASASVAGGDRSLYAELADLDVLCGTAAFLNLAWRRGIDLPRCRRFRTLETQPYAGMESWVFLTGGSRADETTLPPNTSIVTSPRAHAAWLSTGLRVPMAAPTSFVPGARGRHAEWTSPEPVAFPALPRGTVALLEVSLGLRSETVYRMDVSLSTDGVTWRPPLTMCGTKSNHLLHLVEPADLDGVRFMRLGFSTGMQYTGLFFGCIVDAVCVHRIDPHANRKGLPVWDPSWD